MLERHITILKKRNFLCLWLGQIISQFGDRLTQMALIGLVYRLEPGSSIGLAKMMSLAIIPVFLFSPVAGVYVDRWNKQKTMYISDSLRGFMIILIPLVFLRFNAIIPIYILVFLSFSFGRFFIPAKMAIVPELVEEKDFIMANSLVSITAMIAAVLGFGFGGIIVEKWGVNTAFVVDAATFFLSAIFILSMKRKEEKTFNPKELFSAGKDAFIKVKKSLLIEAKEGMKYLFETEETKYAAKIFFVLFAMIGSLYTVFIVFIQNTLSSVTTDLGWMAVGIGVGLFCGSVIYGRIGHKFSVKKVIDVALLVTSAYLVFFASFLKWHPWPLMAFGGCMLLGGLASPIVIAVNSLIHQESKNGFWGRIFSSLEVVIHIAFLIFMFLSSYLAEIMTPFTIINSVGIIAFLFALYNLIKNHDTRKRA